MTWGGKMELRDAIAGRRSVRAYSGQVVDEMTLRRLIDAAVLAPNAVNEQPWTFTVVRDAALLDSISADAKAHLLATLAAGPRTDGFRAVLGEAAFHIFYHAPALIVISATAPGPWVVEDCALAAANLMLAAYGEGLGSCWIGFAQSYLNTAPGKRALGLPEACMPVAPIIVGHAKTPPLPALRRAPEIHWLG
ncbi:nitroreductase family protein [Duganella margarita]|nr:nitroreductase family protein [Duganella margarita]